MCIWFFFGNHQRNQGTKGDWCRARFHQAKLMDVMEPLLRNSETKRNDVSEWESGGVEVALWQRGLGLRGVWQMSESNFRFNCRTKDWKWNRISFHFAYCTFNTRTKLINKCKAKWLLLRKWNRNRFFGNWFYFGSLIGVSVFHARKHKSAHSLTRTATEGKQVCERVCVWDRERERVREKHRRQTETEKQIKNLSAFIIHTGFGCDCVGCRYILCVCMLVY